MQSIINGKWDQGGRASRIGKEAVVEFLCGRRMLGLRIEAVGCEEWDVRGGIVGRGYSYVIKRGRFRGGYILSLKYFDRSETCLS
jgi:hypothetical protein